MKFVENVEKKDYQNFTLKHAKSHFLQSYEWGNFCKKIKNQIPKYIGVLNEDNKLIATALILLKKTPLGYSYGYCPRGFILDYNDKDLIKFFTDSIKNYMKKNKIIYIKFDPDIPYHDIDENANPIENGNNNYELYNYMLDLGYKHTGFYKLYEGNQPRYTFRIDLNRSWEDIESKMSKSFLKSVKRSKIYDFHIDNEINIEEFYRLIQFNSSKDDFDAHNLNYYKVFTEELGKNDLVKYFNISINPKHLINKFTKEIDNLKIDLEKNKKRATDINNQINKLEKDINVLKTLKDENVVICSLICVYTKNRAWSMFIGSDDVANLTSAVARCYYEAIKDAYNQKYDFFDLFGTPGDPNTKYKNLAKLHDFKRKFGDKYIEFIGEFDLINNKFLYNLLPIMLKIYRKLRRLL